MTISSAAPSGLRPAVRLAYLDLRPGVDRSLMARASRPVAWRMMTTLAVIVVDVKQERDRDNIGMVRLGDQLLFGQAYEQL